MNDLASGAGKPPVIAVLGSINMDLVMRCQHLPQPGETILATSVEEVPGGKGANQAVAAARLGAQVRLLGRVGDDGFGHQLRSGFQQEQIDCQAVQVTTGQPTGIAIVCVDPQGENSIIVSSGANACLLAEDVDGYREHIEAADALLVQLETPLPAVLAAMQVARECGLRIILDPAPVPAAWDDRLLQADLICPNEAEASAICGFNIASTDDAVQAAEDLQRRGASRVAITLGARGVLLHDQQTHRLIPPPKVNAVDSTAAGDAFAGAVAVQWLASQSLLEATQFAAAAGAWAASHPGAQPSLGTRQQIEQLRKSN